MSDNRKYYYLKLKENYFDDDSIVLLESMQDGVLYSNILLKLYLKSLKHGASAPRSGPRPVPAARPVWGPYGKAPRFPPALRFVCFCENFPLPAQKSPPFFWPSAFFVLPLHPLSPSSGPCARGGVVL